MSDQPRLVAPPPHPEVQSAADALAAPFHEEYRRVVREAFRLPDSLVDAWDAIRAHGPADWIRGLEGFAPKAPRRRAPWTLDTGRRR